MKKIVYLFALLTLTLGLEGQNFHFEKVASIEDSEFYGLYALDNQTFTFTNDGSSYFYDGNSLIPVLQFSEFSISGFEKNNGDIFMTGFRGSNIPGYYTIYLWQNNTKKWQIVLEVENKKFSRIFTLDEENIYLWGYDVDNNGNQSNYNIIFLFKPQENTLEEIFHYNNNDQRWCKFIHVKNHNNILFLFENYENKVWKRFNGEEYKTLHIFENTSSFEEIKVSPDTSTFFFLSYSQDMIYFWQEKEQKMDSINLETTIRTFFPLNNQNLVLFSSPEIHILNIKSGEKQRINHDIGVIGCSGYTGKNVAFLASAGSRKSLYKMTITGSSIETKKTYDNFIYPNPVDDVIWIHSPIIGEKKVKIFNLKGQILIEQDFFNSDDLEINISNLSPGIYLSQINTSQGVLNQKFIKK